MSDERVLLPTATAAESWRGLRTLLRRRRVGVVVALGLLLAGSLIAMVTPLVLGHIVDMVTDGEGAAAITGPVVTLVGLAVLAGVLEVLGQSTVARVGEPAVAELREQVMDRALALDLEQVEASGTGDLLTRVTEDMELVADAARGVFAYFATAALTIALTLVGLAGIDWRFLLAGLLATPIQFWAVRRYVEQAAAVYAGERVARGALGQQQLDSIGGAATVRAYRLQPEHHAEISRRSLDVVAFAQRAVRMQTTFFARLNGAEFVGLSAVLVAGFFAVRSEAATIGEATAAALLFIRLFDPINIVLGLVDDIQEAGAGLARLIGVTQVPPRRTEPAVPVEPSSADVEVRGVGYSYRDGHPVLHDVELTVGAGQRVAVVGASGAGKSTLAKLVAGVHQAPVGAVRIGGTGIETIDSATLRRTVALVTQELHVFAGTVADDLRLGRSDASDDELWAALDLVDASAWVRALPEAIDTIVGEGGQRLDPTRTQQLGLARLALSRARVAILDEATAESGSAGARVLEQAAARVLAGRTSIVVAHRLSQAAASDLVVVMEDGRVVERGTHDELVAAGGVYASLWSAWSAHRT